MLRFFGLRLDVAMHTMPGDEFWPLTMLVTSHDGFTRQLVKEHEENRKADEAGASLDAPELQGLASHVVVSTQEG